MGFLSTYIMAATMMGGLADGFDFGDKITLHNGVNRERHPWDTISLSKAERRGKTPDEMQAARKSKWIAAQRGEEVGDENIRNVPNGKRG